MHKTKGGGQEESLADLQTDRDGQNQTKSSCGG